MRNIFLEKSYTKFGREATPRSFYKKSKLSISLDQQSKTSLILYLLFVHVEVYQNILTLRCLALGFTLYIKKRDMALVPLLHFLHEFWRKLFLMLCSINCPYLISWLLLPLEILGNMCIGIICCPVCDVINFEINLSFFIMSIFT